MNVFRNQIVKKVEIFYNSMPFNFTDSAKDASKKIQRQNAIMAYPDLHKVLSKAKKSDCVLDVGCGAGWFPNTLTYHYKLKCIAVDLSETAVDRACKIADRLGVQDNIFFKIGDLFSTDIDRCFMVVNSIGVLHHTHDCQAALTRIAQFVQPGGYIHIALYHKYGRKPFLEYFSEERRAFLSENEKVRKNAKRKAFEKYKELNSHIKDETLLLSWCRDQIFHPHETHHTLKEICQWLLDLNFSPISTSLNGFKPVESWDTIFNEEGEKESLSYRLNYIDKKYYPGFFSVFAQRD